MALRIGIVGSGAVGGYYGCRLAQHGQEVHFLLRSDYDAVRQNGWTVRSHLGDFVLPPGKTWIYRAAADMPSVDLVLVALKATANDQYAALITPLLHENTTILTLQNGLGNEERLAELFGAHRIVGGLAFTCINRIEPGVIHHTDHGFIRIGEYVGGPSQRTRDLAAVFNASMVKCDVLQDLRYGRWEKLVWNIPFNGLGGIADLDTQQILRLPEGVALVQAIMAEVIAAARAEGRMLPESLIEDRIKMTQTMGPYLSSMQIDRRERRPMEIEAILGEPLRAAQRSGVNAPLMAMLYTLGRLVHAH